MEKRRQKGNKKQNFNSIIIMLLRGEMDCGSYKRRDPYIFIKAD